MSEPPAFGTPRVSVVMIFLDAGRFMEEAIDSVLAQSLEQWELLLVDDGSTDSSPDIAARYASRFPHKIRVLRHPGGRHLGTAASRNLGFHEARGDYVAMLDADDVYEPQRLERHVRYLDDHPSIGVVISPDLYWRRWMRGSRVQTVAHDQVIGLGVESGRVFTPPTLIAAILTTPGAPMPATCSITFRTVSLRSLGDIPIGFQGRYEDQVLICKLLLSCRAVALDEPLARYRQRVDSVTRGNSPLEARPGSPAMEARSRFLQWLAAYLDELELDLPDVRGWLQDELADIEAGNRPAITASARMGKPSGWQFLVSGFLGRGLARHKHRLHTRRVGRQITRRVRELEADAQHREQDADLASRIRTYWDARVHDTPLSAEPEGTAGYFAALDAYRHEKSDYLLRRVNFDAWAGRDVLEIGCGAGLDLVRFAGGGARVTGVDVSATAVALARNCCRAAGTPATIAEADGARLPFADNNFDLVYCMGVLPFVADPEGVVAEACRVLRPDGAAIFMAYNRRSWMTAMAPLAGGLQGHSDAPGFRLYTAAELDRLLSPFGKREILAERFPRASDRHRGLAGTVFNHALVPVWRGLPEAWVKPFGWHLLAFCRKDRH